MFRLPPSGAADGGEACQAGPRLKPSGAGFIGSHLMEILLHRGGKVRVLDNFATGKQENLNAIQGDFELIRGDVRDLDTCRQAVTGVDYVLHQAALGSVLRYFNVYGPRQDPNSLYAAVIPKFFKAALEGRGSEIHGDGEQTRDFTCVADYAEAKFLAATADLNGQRVFNIAGGRQISVNRLEQEIKRITQTAVEAKHVAPRPGDVRHSLAGATISRGLALMASVRDAKNKLQFDLYYIKFLSLLLDLQIILRTFSVMMRGSR